MEYRLLFALGWIGLVLLELVLVLCFTEGSLKVCQLIVDKILHGKNHNHQLCWVIAI